jgi:nanoRNase/pAp phosphatase (c-di-AMP/oligoRNAs hydrolase)
MAEQRKSRSNEDHQAMRPVAVSTGRYAELDSCLRKHSGNSHLVLLQGTPDPDAISSALALEFLGAQYGIDTTIVCFSSVSHHENRALVKKLGIKLVLFDASFDFSVHQLYSIVDSQKCQTAVDRKLTENSLEFLAFIDHHRSDASAQCQASFIDVREHVGSTASILCEYLRDACPKGLEPSDSNHVRLATSLMHGIRSDTGRFMLATPEDYQAAAFISPCVDHNVIEIIERTTFSSSMLGLLENALVNRKIIDNFIFSDVGFVRSIDRDGIPQAAELLLAREGTDTVLVFGIVDEKAIDGSFRTRSETITPDEFLKGFLGVSPESGQYYGGGNVRDKGGFQIPLGFLSLYEDKNQVYAMARELIEKSFLDYIGRAVQQT